MQDRVSSAISRSSTAVCLPTLAKLQALPASVAPGLTQSLGASATSLGEGNKGRTPDPPQQDPSGPSDQERWQELPAESSFPFRGTGEWQAKGIQAQSCSHLVRPRSGPASGTPWRCKPSSDHEQHGLRLHVVLHRPHQSRPPRSHGRGHRSSRHGNQDQRAIGEVRGTMCQARPLSQKEDRADGRSEPTSDGQFRNVHARSSLS